MSHAEVNGDLGLVNGNRKFMPASCPIHNSVVTSHYTAMRVHASLLALAGSPAMIRGASCETM